MNSGRCFQEAVLGTISKIGWYSQCYWLPLLLFLLPSKFLYVSYSCADWREYSNTNPQHNATGKNPYHSPIRFRGISPVNHRPVIHNDEHRVYPSCCQRLAHDRDSVYTNSHCKQTHHYPKNQNRHCGKIWIVFRGFHLKVISSVAPELLPGCLLSGKWISIRSCAGRTFSSREQCADFIFSLAL